MINLGFLERRLGSGNKRMVVCYRSLIWDERRSVICRVGSVDMSPFTEPQHSLGDESKILETEHARAIGPMAMKIAFFSRIFVVAVAAAVVVKRCLEMLFKTLF
jgi:hypothetical protein